LCPYYSKYVKRQLFKAFYNELAINGLRYLLISFYFINVFVVFFYIENIIPKDFLFIINSWGFQVLQQCVNTVSRSRRQRLLIKAYSILYYTISFPDSVQQRIDFSDAKLRFPEKDSSNYIFKNKHNSAGTLRPIEKLLFHSITETV
jgi:hypothetical protein